MLLQPLGQIHHLLDDLPGEILEVLRHHDFHQLRTGLPASRNHMAKEVTAANCS